MNDYLKQIIIYYDLECGFILMQLEIVKTYVSVK